LLMGGTEVAKRILKVNMLGEFSVTLGDARISDGSNRAKKIWLLLAYLMYHRNRVVPQEELISLLWGNEEKNENPTGALKTAFWRARQILDGLGEDMGRDLILRKGGGCRWNPDIPMELDAEKFENLYRAGKHLEDEDIRLDALREALALYQGDFLYKLGAEEWVAPVMAYYHNLYIAILMECAPMLLERRHFQEVEELCRAAVKVEPYHEGLYQHLMRSLMAQNENEKAIAVYEEMREQLYSNLGIAPDEVSQAIYREASRSINGYAYLPDTIREQLREEKPGTGAVICDFNMFRAFYQAEARAAIRRGDAIHVGVLSVTDDNNKELAQRSLERAMENLQVQIQRSLRRSDIAARCSPSQFVVMLLQANYENSCMVCDRIVRAFARAYPHSPAKIHCTVMPLEPLMERS